MESASDHLSAEYLFLLYPLFLIALFELSFEILAVKHKAIERVSNEVQLKHNLSETIDVDLLTIKYY